MYVGYVDHVLIFIATSGCNPQKEIHNCVKPNTLITTLVFEEASGFGDNYMLTIKVLVIMYFSQYMFQYRKSDIGKQHE